ncbi:DNA-directed RNA polymerase subunit L [archaeon]|jgi:DNA-directed RNA polymerase subunit L|nr:DNA-directed RNA polymerase subunit L [archaeon]MBT4416951.1 DNA-directed RNA polymerase subunit L [archaeon]
MEIKVVESEKNRIKLEFVAKSHTLVNAIVKELWNDKETVIAGYNLKHPQVDNPVLILETKTKVPKKVLLDAISRLEKGTKEFASAFKKLK